MRKTKITEQSQLDPWKLFLNAMRAPMTRDRYQTRVAKFFDFIGIRGKTKNKKARTALVKNKVRQIIEEKAHLNPVYYEKMKERLEAIIRDEREERREDADYFNRYEKVLKDLYGQEEERNKLGFTNAFEFAVYETLLKEVDDGNISKDITKKIFEGIKEEITEIPDWQNKLTSQKKLESSIYDILNETGNKKIENNIDDIIEQVIELAKRNLR